MAVQPVCRVVLPTFGEPPGLTQHLGALREGSAVRLSDYFAGRTVRRGREPLLEAEDRHELIVVTFGRGEIRDAVADVVR